MSFAYTVRSWLSHSGKMGEIWIPLGGQSRMTMFSSVEFLLIYIKLMETRSWQKNPRFLFGQIYSTTILMRVQ